jgi:hypothetical protein
MLPTKLAIVTLALALPGVSQQVTITPPEAGGIELIGSQSQQFQSSVEAVIGQQALAQLGPYLPFTVVLKNNSSQALLGYKIQWQLDGSRIGLSAVAAKNPDFSLNPGMAFVFVPGFQLTASPSPEV